MPKLEHLSEIVRKQMLMWPCVEYDDTPWTPMPKPLSECKVGLVTTAGLHVRGDKPFIPNQPGGDTSYRKIPRSTPARDIVQSHASIGFDHTGMYRDINVTFPIDRLDELQAQGKIGSLADHYYSYMGALRDVTGIIENTGPEVAQHLKNDGVEVVLLTPT
ncbi:MAG: glycine/sarcosine/betaine reductase selenoprotein B family protein [Chloroflexota bacterium]|nr:glycine/sarcosine/betaine reductase selenoprotein B family protein [Chloroflexota bacterium]